MAVLAADTTHEYAKARLSYAFTIVNADIIYGGALCGLCMPGHATPGYLIPYAPAAYVLPVGFALEADKTGDTSATPPPKMAVDVGGGIRKLTVTGLAGTVADVGKSVWATNDGTFTLTEQTNGWVLGIITEEVSATQAWVLTFPLESFLVQYFTEVAQAFTPTPTPTP